MRVVILTGILVGTACGDGGVDTPAAGTLSACAAAQEPLVALGSGEANGVVWGRLSEAADGTIVAIGGNFENGAPAVTFWRLDPGLTPVDDLEAGDFLHLSAVAVHGAVVAIGDERERVRLFDIASGQLVDMTATTDTVVQNINGIVFEPGGERLIFADGEFVADEDDLIAWTPGGARETLERGAGSHLAFTFFGDRLVTAGGRSGAALNVWASGLAERRSVDLATALTLEEGSLAYGLARTAEGARVAVGGPAGLWPRGFLATFDGPALLGEAPALGEPRSRTFDDGAPWQLALTSDDRYIVSLMMGPYDVRFFDWGGDEVLRLTPPEETFGMLVTGDGRHLVTSQRDRLVLWGCPG